MAFDLRISDWSSDVCSSVPLRQLALFLGGNRSDAAGDDLAALGHKALEQTDVLIVDLRRVLAGKGAGLAATEKWACHVLMPFLRCHVVAFATWAAITTIPAIATITRSEEHTSELQSLMRNSYAVF